MPTLNFCISLAPVTLDTCVCEHVHFHTRNIHTSIQNMWAYILQTYLLKCTWRQERWFPWKANSCIWWLGPTLLSQLIMGDYVLISTLRLQKKKGQLVWDRSTKGCFNYTSEELARKLNKYLSRLKSGKAENIKLSPLLKRWNDKNESVFL